MSSGYRITVRGIMSERFCAGFPGLDRSVDASRTMLTGGSASAPPLDDVLARLGNLGLEVVGVEHTHGTAAHPALEA